MPQLVQAEGLGQIEFPDDATPDEISREVNRIDLARQMDAARKESSNSYGSAVTGLARGFTDIGGRALKGLAAAASNMPADEPGYVMPPEERALEERAANQTPAEKYQRLTQSNPVFQAGQTSEDYWNKQLPLAPQEERGTAAQVGRGAGSLAGLAATGPAAPAVIGLSSAGEHITSDFESGKQAGLSDDAAAESAMRKAVASGTLQAGIFWALPPVMRNVTEKYLIDKLGAEGFKRFLAGRVAAGAEGAALGATTQGAENVVQGQPLTEGMAGGAGGMAAMNLLLPWLHEREQGQTQNAEVQPNAAQSQQQQPAVTAQPQSPPAAFRPTMVERALAEARAAKAQEEAEAAQAAQSPKAEVTPDLAAQLEAAMRGNQLAETPPPSSQPEVENVRPGANGEEILAQKEAEAAKEADQALTTAEPVVAEAPKVKSQFFVRPRPDGVTDVLDAIQDLGGIRPPGKKDAGGEYDGWKEAMVGPARMLAVRDASHRPDTILSELRTVHGFDFETPDEMYVAIRKAVAERQTLAETGGGPIAQQDRFWTAATSPASDAGLIKINAQELGVGDTFRLRGEGVTGEKLTVTAVDPDTGELTVKDGPKIGVQTLPDGAEIWVERKTAPKDVQRAALVRRLEGKEGPSLADKKAAAMAALAEAARPKAKPEPSVPGNEFTEDLQRQKSAEQGEPNPEERGILSGTAAEEWANRTIAEGAKRLHAGLDPELMAAYAIKGAAVLERGLRNFGEWSAEMVKELGDTIKPYLDRLWAESIKHRLNVIGESLSNLDQGGGPGRGDANKSLRYQYVKESNGMQKLLAQSPEHVADLLKQMDQLTRQIDISKKAGNGLGANDARQNWEFLSGQLEKVDPKLLNRVYNDLVARREIMGSNLPELPKGRTLGELTNWLDAQLNVSPKASARERFGMAQRLADEFSRGKAAVIRLADRVTAAWEAFKEQFLRPPIDGDFRRTIKEWFFEKQWTGLETHRWVQSIRDAVPSRLRRQAISVYLDAGGDEAMLREQAGLVPDKFRQIWQTALNLTDGEKELANRIRQDFATKLDDGQSLGLIDKGREDYGVPQVWRVAPKNEGEWTGDRQKPARNPGAKLDPRDPFFALKRANPSYFDGIMMGGDPKGLDIADLVGLYNAEFHNALADRTVIKTLKDDKTPEGDPIVMLSGGVRTEPAAGYSPDGKARRVYFVDSNWRNQEAVTKDGRPYRTIDHWALRDWVVKSRDADGNPIIVRGDFLVHPDYYRFLKNELSKSWLRDPDGGGKYFNWLLNSAAFLKASKFASATFHLATIGEHAIFHAVSPITRGVELDPARDPKLGKLMYHGLELGFGHGQELFEEGLASHGGILGHVPGLGEAMQRMSDFLFKRYIPAIKAKAGEAVLDRNMARYSGKLSEDQIYELTAQQMNAAFGMQNWRLLGTNKTMLDLNRLLLTAPDFFLARAKVVGQALKPYNREQRYFLLAQAALVYGAARALNMVLDGDPHWEAANALNVVYHGRAYAARFLVNDIYHLATDPKSFAQGRLGPLPRSAIEAITGRDMRTGARIDVPFETNSATWHAAQVLVKDLADWFVPVGTEGFLPGAKGKEQTGPGQVALALVGVGSHKYTAQTQVYDWARDFNRSSSDPATVQYQKQRDAEARSASPYRKLTALLDADDLQGALKEYDSLLEEGRKDQTISSHFYSKRPFTGSGARERAFLDSLTDQQKAVYDKAEQERAGLADKFEQMLKLKPTPALTSQEQ